MRNLPYQDNASNRIWLEIVQLAEDLLAWTQALALTGRHRVAEAKRLRLCLFVVAGRLIRTARRTRLRLDGNWPRAHDIDGAMQRLHALAPG
jgi:Transposase DDE domain group 1